MLLDFTTCHEVTDELVNEALAPSADLLIPPPRVRVLALLQRMFRVAEPGRGAPRILLVLARVAPCSWLEGDLLVKLQPDGEDTRIELLVDDGASVERLCPAATLRAPMTEFLRALALRPERVEPLVVEISSEAIVLLRATLPPPTGENRPSYEIAHQHILLPEREARPLAQEQPEVEWSRPKPPGKRRSIPPAKKNSIPPPKKGSIPPPPKKGSIPPPKKGSIPPPPKKGSIPPKKAPPPAQDEASSPEAITVRRQVPLNETTRMPAKQAAELVARIRLRKQQQPAGAAREESATPEPTGGRGGGEGGEGGRG